MSKSRPATTMVSLLPQAREAIDQTIHRKGGGSRSRPSGPPAPPVLRQVDCQVRLQDLLAEVRLTQAYRNAEDLAVEAVFTFPVPLAATLLEREVELGERRLRGSVVAHPEAVEAYENAVADGDAAVLVEEAGPGLCTANCGNLAPGETARLHLRWAEVLAWQFPAGLLSRQAMRRVRRAWRQAQQARGWQATREALGNWAANRGSGA